MNKICVVGDLILDIYFYCVPRFNPESDCPCVTGLKSETKIGGAGNVNENLKALGDEVDFFYGGEGTTKTRFFQRKKYIFGIEDESKKYSKKELKLREEKLISDFLKNKYKYVIVSDSNKGVITKKIAKAIMSSGAVVLVDSKKPIHFNWFKGCYLIKPNLKEFKKTKNFEQFSNVLLTKGEKGMTLIQKGKIIKNYEGIKVNTVDVTGAGDTVIATLVHFLNKGKSLDESITLANKAGALSVTHHGVYYIKEKELV